MFCSLTLVNTGLSQNKISDQDVKTKTTTSANSHKILFLDDTWIDTISNLKLSLHQPQKYSDYPVLAGSYAWENSYVQTRQGPLWIPEEKVWKIWYNTSGKPAPKGSTGVEEENIGASTCLAVSRDLINWEKPFTRIISFRGSKENNIVIKGFIAGPVYTGNDPDPQRKYKAMLNRYVDGVMSWHPIFSPDGINWSKPLENGVRASDESQLIYDEFTGEYLFYCKLFLPEEIREKLVAGRPIQPNNHRCVYLSTSRNFIDWTTPELVFHADEPDQEICARDQIWFYYLGGSETHDMGESRVSQVNGGVGLAKLRIDGFVSVDAGSQPGSLTTNSIDIKGDNIFLNLEAAGGEVRAELLDAKSLKPIKGFTLKDCVPMDCDSVSAQIRWSKQENLQNLAGKKLRIRFSMKQAKLYSIRI